MFSVLNIHRKILIKQDIVKQEMMRWKQVHCQVRSSWETLFGVRKWNLLCVNENSVVDSLGARPRIGVIKTENKVARLIRFNKTNNHLLV